jgi:plastocyanin
VTRALVVGLVAMTLVACGDDGPVDRSPNEPYPITAIDYHFHDAHPSLPISPDRAVVFVNRSRNIHNVTLIGTDYSRDLPVGDELLIDPISSLLPEEGVYDFFCSYHRDRDMVGVLVIEG